ncbi:MAG: ribose-5-phosphate isomerase RpiA [Meiothermus sp.]|nr:ribose-5-phosphate isomerase RpiA [Meiothermus sp.]
MDLEHFKQQAALEAVKHVQSGMTVGLGTGSTAKYAVLEIGRKLREGELTDVCGIPTSEATRRLALEQGVPLVDLGEGGVDVAIDGADEIDPQLNLIKGLGGALLREKIVENTAGLFVVIADETKLVNRLGRGRLPVEVIPFGYKSTLKYLQKVVDVLNEGPPSEGRVQSMDVRMEGDRPFLSDGGNYIVHLNFSVPLASPWDFEVGLKGIPGVVETGLFLRYAHLAVIAGRGGITTLEGDRAGV